MIASRSVAINDVVIRILGNPFSIPLNSSLLVSLLGIKITFIFRGAVRIIQDLLLDESVQLGLYLIKICSSHGMNLFSFLKELKSWHCLNLAFLTSLLSLLLVNIDLYELSLASNFFA